jgi:hypothetical protein
MDSVPATPVKSAYFWPDPTIEQLVAQPPQRDEAGEARRSASQKDLREDLDRDAEIELGGATS